MWGIYINQYRLHDEIIWKIECKWCNYWFLYHSCHIFTYSGGWVYLNDGENIIFHSRFPTRCHGCERAYAVPLCFPSITEISRRFSAARFFCSVPPDTVWDIRRWSLAYLKIVIRDKEDFCHCGQFVCCLKTHSSPPPPASSTSHPNDCLVFHSAALVATVAQAEMYSSRLKPRDTRAYVMREAFISDVMWLFFLYQQTGSNLLEVCFSWNILDIKLLCDSAVLKTCNNIGAT